ncbi:MAG: hypothetical protein ACJ74H_07415 [Thermoanaerobaculia bacterium]
MNATTSAEPLLYLLMDVVQQTHTLRHEVSVLDLPPDAATYFQSALRKIEQQAAEFIAFCMDGQADH